VLVQLHFFIQRANTDMKGLMSKGLVLLFLLRKCLIYRKQFKLISVITLSYKTAKSNYIDWGNGSRRSKRGFGGYADILGQRELTFDYLNQNQVSLESGFM